MTLPSLRPRFAFALLLFVLACGSGSASGGRAGATSAASSSGSADAASGATATSAGSSGATATSGGAGGASAGQRDWAAFPAVFTSSGATEIDALGDIHGDPATMVKVLRVGGLIGGGPPYHWTGGAALLVITGDVIDKGNNALGAIDILMALAPEAKAAGGELVVTLGNHEAEFLADPMAQKSLVFQGELAAKGLSPADVAAGASPYGAFLRTRPLAALVDGWFFSHGGNAGGMSAAALGAMFQAKFEANAFGDPFLVGDTSLLEQQVWWATGKSSTAVIDADLAALPAKHIVFGHDPGKVSFPDDPQGTRDKGQMVMRYGGRIFMIDTGMSYAVGYTSGALLRIRRGSPTTATSVRADGSTELLWSGSE